MTAAHDTNMKLMLAMTGGAHSAYLTNFFDGNGPRFDRSLWTARQQLFNTSQIKSAVAARVTDGTVVGADVMDEPHVPGAGAWGPPGTMVKNGTSQYDTYRVTVATGGAPTSATSIPIAPLYKALPSGTRLTFLPGLGKTAVLTQAAAQNATSLTVLALPTALSAGDAAHSNSIDNMVAEVKNIFPTLAVGVTHQHALFQPNSSYAVADFIIDQYNWIRGNVTTYKNDGLALGMRDGHKVVFSINVLDGGTQDTDGSWDCIGKGGKGTYAPNCRMTPAQVQTFASVLASGGPGFFMWRYDSVMDQDPNYVAVFQAIAAQQAQLTAMSWHR
jgi:hypothetical protein